MASIGDLSATEIPVLTHDRDLTIKRVNSAAMRVIDAEGLAVVGRTLFDLSPSESGKISKYHDEVAHGSKSATLSLQLRADKVERYIILLSVPKARRRSSEHLCHVRDDTRRTVAENNIKTSLEYMTQIRREKTVFVSNIIHEIRTPMNNLMLTKPADTNVSQCLKSISRHVANLSYALKFDSDRFPVPTDKPTSITEMIKQSKTDVSSFFQKPDNVEYSVSVDKLKDSADVVVDIDGHLLGKVLSEVFITCSDISDAKIDLSVEIDSSTQEVRFVIIHHGQQDDVQMLNEALESFWGGSADASCDVSASLSKNSMGVGLGLNVCCGILQSMSSNLEISRDVKGAKYHFSIRTIIIEMDGCDTDRSRQTTEWTEEPSAQADEWIDEPCAQADDPPAGKGEAPAPANLPELGGIGKLPRLRILEVSGRKGKTMSSSARGVKTILVTEDNVMTKKLCENIIKRMGHTVHTASNGAIAVNMVSSQCDGFYDMILMDFRMPLMNGVDATKKLKQDTRFRTPIIGFTAEEDNGVLKSAIECGMAGILNKPVSKQELELCICKHCS